jgi:hypothetical protein
MYCSWLRPLQDPPEGFVQNYCLLIGDRSFSNFQKVRPIELDIG